MNVFTLACEFSSRSYLHSITKQHWETLSGPSVWSRSMAERCCLMLITLFTPLWAAVWLTHAHTWLKPHNAPHCIIGNLLLKDTVRTSHNTLATIQMPLATAAHRWNPRTHMMWEFELKHMMLRVNQSKSLQVNHTEASYTHIWRSKTTWRTITKICSFTWTNQKNTKHIRSAISHRQQWDSKGANRARRVSTKGPQ